MRTTITLDADVALLVERSMEQRDLTFKETVNRAIRDSLGEDRPLYKTPTYSMGSPRNVDLDRSLALAAAMEDEEIVRKLDLRK
ncbi:MAG: antitoxin [Acidobacteria bacterium]|nr:antitoxin [Acidobacteriota bacterium]